MTFLALGLIHIKSRMAGVYLYLKPRLFKQLPSCSLFDYLLMNEAALNQLPGNMHDSEEEGNANGFVSLSVCLSDKVVFFPSFLPVFNVGIYTDLPLLTFQHQSPNHLFST